VHGQLYGYNDLMVDPLRKVLGDSVFRLAPAAAFLLERVMIGMVYLHSDDSGVLKLTVHGEERSTGLGEVRGEASARSDAVLDEYLRTLTAARHDLGGRPLRRLASKNPPGLSQHFGGTLPMKREPDPWSTDVLGRPWQCTRTHCVDSSIFPSIPGTPTALILMANALRIAGAVGAL
jgi:choline dehydrogenase-like flavoprotein